MKRYSMVATVLAIVFMLTGCGRDVVTTENSIEAEKQETVTGQLSENTQESELTEKKEKLLTFDLMGAGSITEFEIDGDRVVRDADCSYQGFGAILYEEQINLLEDYKIYAPDAYAEIIDLAFGEKSGICKVILADVTEAAEDEKSDDADETDEDDESDSIIEDSVEEKIDSDSISVRLYNDIRDNNDKIEMISGSNEAFLSARSMATSPIGDALVLSGHDVYGTGLTNSQGILDVTSDIVNTLSAVNNTFYFSPYINATFPGDSYKIGGIIQANSPFTGLYSVSDEYLILRHISDFVESGWRFVTEDISESDDDEGDIPRKNYLTLVSESGEDATVILVNNSAKTSGYNIKLNNTEFSSKNFNVWESRGYLETGEETTGFLDRIGATCVKEDVLTVFLKPFSVMTITTTDKTPDLSAFEQYKNSAKKTEEIKEKYTYDFGYDEESDDITGGMEGVTTFGDVNWKDLDMSLQAHFVEGGGNNGIYDFIGLGCRYNNKDNDENGYVVRIYENSRVELRKDGTVIFDASMKELGFAEVDTHKWYDIRVVVKGQKIKAYLNDYELFTYKDEGLFNTSGCVTVTSSYEKNYFGKLNVKVLDKNPIRIDDFDKSIQYDTRLEGISSTWSHDTEANFKSYNSTVSRGGFGDSFSFEYEGEDFSLIGLCSYSSIDVVIDGSETVTFELPDNNKYRKCVYSSDELEYGKHEVTVVISGGNFTLDAIEF